MGAFLLLNRPSAIRDGSKSTNSITVRDLRRMVHIPDKVSESGKGVCDMTNSIRAYGELFKTYPDVVDVDTLCEMLGGISKKLAYRLLKDGSIVSLKIGRNYKIPKPYVTEYLIGQSAGKAWTSAKLCDSVGVADSGQTAVCGKH